MNTTRNIPHIIGYSQSRHGVWYYEVEILSSEFNTSYTIRRRYSDFLMLYNGLKHFIAMKDLPPFPAKCSILSHLMGTDPMILQERKRKFQDLLNWIHQHPFVLCSKRYVHFIGKAPNENHTSGGYVSLRDYSSPSFSQSFLEIISNKKRSSRSIRAKSSGDLLKIKHIEEEVHTPNPQDEQQQPKEEEMPPRIPIKSSTKTINSVAVCV